VFRWGGERLDAVSMGFAGGRGRGGASGGCRWQCSRRFLKRESVGRKASRLAGVIQQLVRRLGEGLGRVSRVPLTRPTQPAV